jgi:hypothetical protein
MTDPIRARFDALRAGPATAADLDDLWSDLAPAVATDLLGSWSGFAFSTGHPIEDLLVASRWHGKRFDAVDDAQPLVCVAEDGTLYDETARGGASLWNVEFRGEATATMVYDKAPIFDHFKWVDSSTLMGIMNGKPAVVLVDGAHFYFGLERE